MFKIGEFSRLVRVSPRMLRHYEKCGLLYPAEIDRFTGYRWYSAAQIPLLTHIVALRDMGFSIDEIGDILPNFDNKAYMDSVLYQKVEEIQAAMDAEGVKLRRIESLRESMMKEHTDMKYDVVLKELPAVKVLSLREVLPGYDQEGMLWERMGGFMAKHGVACPETEYAGYSIYHDDDHKEADVDVEIAVPVDVLGKDEGGLVYKELDALPLAATLRFAGPYDGYANAIASLAAWIEQNGYTMAGLVRGASIRTAADQSNPANFLTELQIPVKKV